MRFFFYESGRLEKNITEFRSWGIGCPYIPEVKFSAL